MTVMTVHIADVPARAAAGRLLRPLRAGTVPGLLHADVALAAPLRRRSPVPAVQPRRLGQFAFWESRAAAERWDEDNAHDAITGGWYAVLEPLRAFGDWPGLPSDISRSRTTDHDGPSVVITLGRVRATQLARFLRTSTAAERAAAESPGMVWGSAFAKPPFVATCSLWASPDALAGYAYEDPSGPHRTAVAADRQKSFHQQSAFVRFRALAVRGQLDGRNPMDASVASAAWGAQASHEP